MILPLVTASAAQRRWPRTSELSCREVDPFLVVRRARIQASRWREASHPCYRHDRGSSSVIFLSEFFVAVVAISVTGSESTWAVLYQVKRQRPSRLLHREIRQ